MTTEELAAKVAQAKNQISEICIDFRKETGFVISEIDVSIIDASSSCGHEWISGTIDISIKL